MIELTMINNDDAIYYPYRKGMVKGKIIRYTCETEEDHMEYKTMQLEQTKKVTNYVIIIGSKLILT